MNHVTNIRIPKVIHYCWFGRGPLPQLTLKCMESWAEYLPDYQIVRWDEENFDITSNRYVKEAYENKKYAFVSDYVRLYALFSCGGIYMDTDVEVIKSLDRFLDNEAFSGFESKKTIPTGIMGSVKGNEIIKSFLDYYNHKSFLREDGTFDTTTNVKIITDYCLRIGFKPNNKLQYVKGITIYPKTYFCPLDWDSKKSNFSDNTYTIHHFAGSWHDIKDKKRRNSIFWKYFGNCIKILIKVIRLLMGDSVYKKLKKLFY